MSDSLLQRYTGRKIEEFPEAMRPSETESPDDFGAFGWLRGIRDRAVMLELRRKDGDILAVGYGYLEQAEFCPSEGIVLSIAGRKVRIRGRNLNAEIRPAVRLFEGIARHRVSWVREADRHESLTAADRDTVVDAIVW